MAHYRLDEVNFVKGNDTIDAQYGVVFFACFDDYDNHRIAITKQCSGRWVIWRRGNIVKSDDHLEPLHTQALAYYQLTGSGEGFPEVELL